MVVYWKANIDCVHVRLQFRQALASLEEVSVSQYDYMKILCSNHMNGAPQADRLLKCLLFLISFIVSNVDCVWF